LLNHRDEQTLTLVRQKLQIPGNVPIDLSLEKRQILERQITAQLASVLRKKDHNGFILEEAFAIVAEVAVLVS
jgi:hypothetical protein